MNPGLEVLGTDFQKQYQDSLKKRSRFSRLVVTNEVKREVIELVKSDMKPEEGILAYKRDNGNYTILLAEAPINMDKVKGYVASTGNYRLGMLWKGDWITAWLTQEQLDKIQASTREDRKFYVLVGFMKQKMFNGKNQWSMSTYGVITMDEIASAEIEQEKQEEAVQESVDEHKEE